MEKSGAFLETLGLTGATLLAEGRRALSKRIPGKGHGD